MRTNFTFLQKEFTELYTDIVEAERFTFTAPRHSAVLCRIVLEKSVYWLYQNDEDLSLPYNTSLAFLLSNQDFRDIIKPSYYAELDIIRRLGNDAAHGKKVHRLDALLSLKNCFRFLSWLSKYYSQENPEIPAFDESVIPYGDEKDKNAKQLADLEKKYEQEREEALAFVKQQEALAQENAALKAQLAAITERKEERKHAYQNTDPVPLITSEKDTRKFLIDLLLREAGWDSFVSGRDIEYEVDGMPLSTNASGKGYVDYVLWDNNGKPLAVVEAKKTLHSAEKGKHQAVLYANSLEKRYQQRPIIFYTNGFDIYLWEDTFYTPRKISGFYTKEALQTLFRRKSQRKDLRHFTVNKEIAGRTYQLEAIQRTAEHLVTVREQRLVGKHRKALLVMATGSGKTRTAAAMVDMFTKCDWAKRVLFLADRNALVTQAKNAFKKYVPHLSAIDLTKEKDDNEARLVFSTYPTILNRIDTFKANGERTFGVGHFDIIIIDEAHRSVYLKYKAIFDYFDAILVGLTATPKKEMDKNTYQLFDIEDDNPTFAYELAEAVGAGYLVPPKGIKVPVKFPRQGIKYKDLSDKDKKHYEEVIGLGSDDEDELDISKSQINSFLYNTQTVDLVLDHLMTYGQKVESGDKLGKTIIFAKNHRHAIFIEERFNKNYPEYCGSFLQVIDNYADKAQDLLERFCDDTGADKDPQIAVSVDMMDTGVDAPRVLNLVFFKEVKSYAKYWQMIGRGTRLCENLFGPGKNKEFFLIFDICGNFEFFEEKPDGYTPSLTKSLQQRLFEAQLEVVFTLMNHVTERSEEETEFMEDYINQLHQKVVGLDENRFEVRQHLKYVLKYKQKEAWQILNHSDVIDIQTHLSNLVSYTEDREELAKKFDLLIYILELNYINGNKVYLKYVDQVTNIAKDLELRFNIPKVKQKEALIRSVTQERYWSSISLKNLENLRVELRELMFVFRDENKKAPIYTTFTDDLDSSKVEEVDLLPTYSNLTNYKERVEQFIIKNKNHLVIDKLYRNIPLTPTDLLVLEGLFNEEKIEVAELQEKFEVTSLSMFVRKIVGLDQSVAEQHFARFIQEENLSANQIKFVEKIISFFVKNGVLDRGLLTKPPFNDMSDSGILGVFEGEDGKLNKILQLINEINENVA